MVASAAKQRVVRGGARRVSARRAPSRHQTACCVHSWPQGVAHTPMCVPCWARGLDRAVAAACGRPDAPAARRCGHLSTVLWPQLISSTIYMPHKLRKLLVAGCGRGCGRGWLSEGSCWPLGTSDRKLTTRMKRCGQRGARYALTARRTGGRRAGGRVLRWLEACTPPPWPACCPPQPQGPRSRLLQQTCKPAPLTLFPPSVRAGARRRPEGGHFAHRREIA